MPKCFCGCGDDVRGFGARGANKMGMKTVPVNNKLRATHAVVSERQAQSLYGMDAAPLLADIERKLAAGAGWEAFWADWGL
jgi:hypothetical protein